MIDKAGSSPFEWCFCLSIKQAVKLVFRGRLVAGAVAGSCNLLSVVGVDDVGVDHRRGVFQAGQPVPHRRDG